LIRSVCVNIQNPLCDSVAPCIHIVHTTFRQNPMKTEEEEKK